MEELKDPTLHAHFSSALQNPGDLVEQQEAIQNAMLSAQKRVRAIAAELEKHQRLNGNVDHSDGIEIYVSDAGTDEPTSLSAAGAPPPHP